MKSWYKSKTVWLAILQAVAGIVVVFSTQHPEIGALVLMKSLLDVTLRFVTQLPVQ